MSNRRIKKIIKRLEKLKTLDLPKRFKKDGKDIYAFTHNEWIKLEPSELIRLKNAYKRLDQEKKDNVEIQVKIIGIDSDLEQPLIDFEDGYQLFENGFQHVITVEPPEL